MRMTYFWLACTLQRSLFQEGQQSWLVSYIPLGRKNKDQLRLERHVEQAFVQAAHDSGPVIAHLSDADELRRPLRLPGQ